jgi:non-specific serine/threonine protein kinase
MKTQKIETVNIIINEKSFTLDSSTKSESEAALAWLQEAKLDKYRAVYELGFKDREPWFSVSLTFLYDLACEFINSLTRQPDLEILREHMELTPTDEECALYIDRMPFMSGMEFVTPEWICNFWKQLNTIFVDDLKNFEGSVQAYLTLHNDKIKIAGRVFFHLVENKSDDAYPFAFMATYSVVDDNNKSRHISLKYALTEYKEDANKLLMLLSTVTEASAKSTFISGLMETGELFLPIRLTAKEAYLFLTEIPIYEQAGILCRVPNWWARKYNQISISLNIGEKKPSLVGEEALLNFSPQLALGGDTLTISEARELLKQEEGLAFLKGKWVEINHAKLEQLLNIYEQAEIAATQGGLTLIEAMQMELNIKNHKALPLMEEVHVKNGEWMKELRHRLKNPKVLDRKPLPHNFYANLRPYQQDGYNWLTYMKTLGFGACLADDMGLGKTIQVIALLESMYEETKASVLLVVPASLLGNWKKELEKFAPLLPFQILHGMDEEKVKEAMKEGFLFITTYGMISRFEAINKKHWNMVILDEAQAIKNPGTKQTKAIKQLKTSSKIALTGTPIENRLSDLWSLFDFLNPGLLGNAKEFATFSKSLTDDAQGYARLKSMIQPFLLRRLKTDKTIISDLPDKIEKKEYTFMTKKQTALYLKLVEDLKTALAQSEGIQKKGLVLSSIMKFKQICNHPDQYLGQNQFKDTYSGKFERLKEICETIYEKRERVLIFTQFREMAEPIANYLETVFHQKGLVLHGGTAVSKRQEMVDEFNGDNYIPFMVLSVKAGGVGLNLTSANHVIHFDRWWNPAVENQATDRAFRIGQKKNVVVYKFITQGTIEEKIDLMIEEKQELAGNLVASSGEKWITDLSDDELIDLLRLEGGKA